MKLITGGQTGADRGALEAARRCGIPTGGWCPLGYRTEQGDDVTLRSFGLRTMGGSYAARTLRNVQEADAVVVCMHTRSPGSLLTIRLAQQFLKPLLVVDPWTIPRARFQIQDFLGRGRYETVMIGGNRESKSPGIHVQVQKLLEGVFPGVLGR